MVVPILRVDRPILSRPFQLLHTTYSLLFNYFSRHPNGRQDISWVDNRILACSCIKYRPEPFCLSRRYGAHLADNPCFYVDY